MLRPDPDPDPDRLRTRKAQTIFGDGESAGEPLKSSSAVACGAHAGYNTQAVIGKCMHTRDRKAQLLLALKDKGVVQRISWLK